MALGPSPDTFRVCVGVSPGPVTILHAYPPGLEGRHYPVNTQV